MLVKYRCGHEVKVPSRNAPFVRRTLCWDCQQLAKKAQEEQRQKFTEALENQEGLFCEH